MLPYYKIYFPFPTTEAIIALKYSVIINQFSQNQESYVTNWKAYCIKLQQIVLRMAGHIVFRNRLHQCKYKSDYIPYPSFFIRQHTVYTRMWIVVFTFVTYSKSHVCLNFSIWNIMIEATVPFYSLCVPKTNDILKQLDYL
jgi:hypothetical protein